MKFMVLLISAASAVTVYRSEDSMAMETRSRQQDRQQRGTLTYAERLREKEEQAEQDGDQQGVVYTTRHRQQQKEQAEKEGDQQGAAFTVRQRQQRKEHNKQIKFQQSAEVPDQEAYFSNIHEENGQTGYSSYVSHEGDEKETSQDGSVEIKKLVPKSSVQVEIYHGPTQQKVLQKEPGYVKPGFVKPVKNKPPKFYNDALTNYKKGKPVFEASPSSTQGSIIVQDYSATTPSSTGYKYRATLPPSAKRKPYGQNKFIPSKGAESTSKYRPSNSYYDSSTTSFSSGTPKPSAQAHSYSSIQETKSPRWKKLSASVEIAAADSESIEHTTTKEKRHRHPKEIHSGLISSHSQFFDSEPERFKAERFDHEKALKGSTSFGISNAVTFGNADFGSEEVKTTTLDGGTAFHIANSAGISQAVDAQMIGSSKGPVQFGGFQSKPQEAKFTEFQPKQQEPKKNTIFSGGFEIPVMTEEEFERNFGKIRHDAPKFNEQRFRPTNRLPFDMRNLQKSLPPPPKHQAQSFTQLSSHRGIPEWAQSQNVPVYKQIQQPYPHQPQQQHSGNMFPSYSFPLPSRRNISLVPERHGKVLSDSDSTEPQQFSVSASYQIDRSHNLR